jgi:2'-phosphotransferase
MVGRGGAGRGRGGRGGSHGAPLPRSIVISKKISYVLRHGAAKEGLKLDEAGYINCAELVCICFAL